jgi:hypothetical protein
MQESCISELAFKHIDIKPADNSLLLSKLTSIRQDYEQVRPRLLFLAEHDPGSKEYQELYLYCSELFMETESIITTLEKTV